MDTRCCKCGIVCIFCVSLTINQLSTEKYNAGHDHAKNGGSMKDNPFSRSLLRDYHIAWKNGFKSFKGKS